MFALPMGLHALSGHPAFVLALPPAQYDEAGHSTHATLTPVPYAPAAHEHAVLLPESAGLIVFVGHNMDPFP